MYISKLNHLSEFEKFRQEYVCILRNLFEKNVYTSNNNSHTVSVSVEEINESKRSKILAMRSLWKYIYRTRIINENNNEF